MSVYTCQGTLVGSQDTAVGIATGYGLDDRGVGASRIFSTLSRPVLGSTQPHPLGRRGSFPGGKAARA
jgi:hypothetical protein